MSVRTLALKRIPLAAAALMVTSVVQAQGAGPGSSGVTLYGQIDAAVEWLGGSTSVLRQPGLSASSPSRWGLRGSEDLGNGLSAIFTLEAGFRPDTGTLNQGGRGFGRQSWVGLSGRWGTLTVGRNYTMLYWSLIDADLLGPNAFGLSSLDNYIPNTRTDNSLAYRGRFGSWTVGATFSVGRDTVNAGPSPAGTACAGENSDDSKACREWSALLKYDRPTWGAAVAVDELRGGPGAFAGLTSSNLKDRRLVLNGYVKVAPSVKLAAGALWRDNDAASPASALNGATTHSVLAWLGAAWTPAPAFTLDGQLQQLRFAEGGDRSTLLALRGTYNLSRRTAVYAQIARISNGPRLAFSVSSADVGANPQPGRGQSGLIMGVRHTF